MDRLCVVQIYNDLSKVSVPQSLKHRHQVSYGGVKEGTCRGASAWGDQDVEVGTVDEGDRCLKEDLLVDHILVLEETEGASAHPEAVTYDTIVVMEAPSVRTISTHKLTMHGFGDDSLVGERIAKGAEFCGAIFRRCVAEFKACLLMLARVGTTDHGGRQIDLNKLAVSKVVHGIQLDTDVVLGNIDCCEGNHLVILIRHDQLVAVRVEQILVEVNLSIGLHRLIKLPARLEACILGLKVHLRWGTLKSDAIGAGDSA